MAKALQLPKYVYAIVAAVVVVIVILLAVALGGSDDGDKWKKAEADFKTANYEAVNKDLKGVGVPSTADHLKIYAQTKFALRDYDAALPAYQKLYKLDKDPMYGTLIGNIYNQQGKFDPATDAYKQVIESNPNYVQVYSNLAVLYKQRGNIAQAQATADQGVKNNPGDVTLHELQVNMYESDTNSQAYKDAVEALRTLNPSDQLIQGRDTGGDTTTTTAKSKSTTTTTKKK